MATFLVKTAKTELPYAEAISVAKQADTVVLVLGLSPRLEGEEMNVREPGFLGGDRTDIKLPARQQGLLEAVAATGKPVVLSFAVRKCACCELGQ